MSTVTIDTPWSDVSKFIRERLRLTRNQLGDRLGISHETVRSWEIGRTTPRARLRPALHQILLEAHGLNLRTRRKAQPHGPRSRLVRHREVIGRTAGRWAPRLDAATSWKRPLSIYVRSSLEEVGFGFVSPDESVVVRWLAYVPGLTRVAHYTQTFASLDALRAFLAERQATVGKIDVAWGE